MVPQTTEDDRATRPRRRFRRLGCFAVALFLFILMLVSPLGVFIIWPPKLWMAARQNRAEYGERRERYDALVRKLAALPLEAERPRHFAVSSDRDPEILEPLDATDSAYFEAHLEGRLVSAWRTATGRVVARFITRDFGHMGVYSLVHSDPAPAPGEAEATFGRSVKAAQVAPTWWAVYDPNY